MSLTEKLFLKSKKHSQKYKKYFNTYDEVFLNYRNKKITFVEIGVLEGGSLEIWKKFFGNKARIIGIDANPECKKFERNGRYLSNRRWMIEALTSRHTWKSPQSTV